MGRVRRVRPDLLRQYREQRRLTQDDLAHAIRQRASGFGTNQVTVSRWEAGQAPHSSVVPHIAAVLGVTVDDLCEAEDDAEAASMAPLAADPLSLVEALHEALGEVLERAADRSAA